ncbi:MAG: redoxin domain-containing protein [Candidatus Pacearchaeota archaeon]
MINKKAPDIELRAFHEGKIKKIDLFDYRGKWVVLFFYPADFSFICPTELSELAENYELLKKMNVEVLSISTDTEFAHKAWHETSEIIKKVKFPMLADPTGRISKIYGTYIEEEGLSVRATFIIDPEGVIKAYEFHNNDIGRSIEELIRKIQAAQFVKDNKGFVCPMNWKPGKEALKPELNIIEKI